jgi:pyruvate dehydrogenase complex dehydrogenase (E1) component
VKGRVIGMHTFGASAPLKELQKKFGFEPDQVVAVAKELLRSKQPGKRKICVENTSMPNTETSQELIYETKNSC